MHKNKTYVKSVSLGGYKSIKDTQITFEPGLNIIIGDNGSGKTNFLAFLDKALDMEVKGDFEVKTKVEVVKGNDNYQWEFIKTRKIPNQNKSIKIEPKIRIPRRKFNAIFKFTYQQVTKSIRNIKLVIDDLQRTHDLSFHQKTFFRYSIPTGMNYFDEQVNLRQYDDDNFFYIEGEGEEDYYEVANMTSIILEQGKTVSTESDLKEELLTTFEMFVQSYDIRDRLAKYSPIKDIRLANMLNIREQQGRLMVENIMFEFLVNDEWYAWRSLSDGTKRLFLLITEVLLNDEIVLIEEPELGVHPHQLHKLMRFLKEQSRFKQIILTTHSPEVLDILDPDELNRIIICEMTKEGTKLKHLEDRKQQKAKAYMEEDDLLSAYWRFSDLETRK